MLHHEPSTMYSSLISFSLSVSAISSWYVCPSFYSPIQITSNTNHSLFLFTFFYNCNVYNLWFKRWSLSSLCDFNADSFKFISAPQSLPYIWWILEISCRVLLPFYTALMPVLIILHFIKMRCIAVNRFFFGVFVAVTHSHSPCFRAPTLRLLLLYSCLCIIIVLNVTSTVFLFFGNPWNASTVTENLVTLKSDGNSIICEKWSHFVEFCIASW